MADPRRYLLALSNPLVIFLAGMLLALLAVPDGGWVDRFYWVIISMTTIGYGDLTPASPLAKLLVALYLPVSVAALAQALSEISAISMRRSIRETDYGDRIGEELLRDECARAHDPNESLTEAEFLVSVLVKRKILDEATINT